MSDDNRVAVIGIGNEWRGDDTVGLAIVRELSRHVSREVSVYEQDGEVTALLDALAPADLALIVDSTSSGAEPGLIRRLDVATDALDDDLPRTSSHAIGLADALELARALDQLPEHVVVYGIEGANFAVGSELSPQVAAAVTGVVAALREEIANHLQPA